MKRPLAAAPLSWIEPAAPANPDKPDSMRMPLKKRRVGRGVLTAQESEAMQALLSITTATIPTQSSSPPSTIALATSPPSLRGTSAETRSTRLRVTDDEASHSDASSVTSSSSWHQQARSTVMHALYAGPPPPLRPSFFKPVLPRHTVKAVPRHPYDRLPKLPLGRPLQLAPGVAKHLVKQTKPICLKLSD